MRIGNDVRSYARAATSVVMATALAFGLSLVLGTIEASAAAEGDVAPAGGEGAVALDGGSAAGHVDPVGADSSSEGAPATAAPQINRVLSLTALSGSDADAGAGVPLVADALAGKPTCFVNQAVPLAGDAVVLGSFVVDGMTYAVTGEGAVELVAVGPEVLVGDLVASLNEAASVGSDGAPSGEDSGSGAPTSPSPSPEGASSDSSEGEEAPEPVFLEAPGSVEHGGIAYAVASIGPRAFAGSDADVVRIPASVASVDEAAFRGSSVGGVEVAEGSLHLSSYEGVLYDADQTSLLLIPESKQGVVRIPKTVDAVPSDAFARCTGVTAIEVDAGNAAFYSEDGCLYDVEGELLARINLRESPGKDALSDDYVAEDSEKGATVEIAPDRIGVESAIGTVAEMGTRGLAKASWELTSRVAPFYESLYNSTPSRHAFRSSDWWYGSTHAQSQFASAMGFNGNSTSPSYSKTYTSNDYYFSSWGSNGSDVRVETDARGTYLRNRTAGEPMSLNVRGSSDGSGWICQAERLYIWCSEHKRFMKFRVEVERSGSYAWLLDCTGAASTDGSLPPLTATVTWNANGGSVSSTSSTVTTGQQATSPTPTKTGYTCTGWWTAATGGTKVCAPGGTTGAITSDITYYAQWSPITYNVRYFDHAGNLKATDAKDYGATFSLRANPGWTAAGYTAVGWARSKGQASKSHSFSQSVSNLASTQGGNVDFYVAETPNRYTVSFSANGGSGGQTAQVTATYGSAMPTISTTKPTRTGYTFQGWYDTSAASGGTRYYTEAGASARTWNKTSNATLYARWTANRYTVSFNANGGSGGQNAQVTATYGSAMPTILTTKPTRTGYAFGGWYDTSAASGGTQYYTAACASARTWNKTSNATLYARWTAITYSVRYFDKAGNHIGTDQKAYDAWFNLRGDPGRTHPAYTAKGWARSANQASASHAFALWTHNLASAQGATFDLYLAEEANRYSISYDLAGGELSGQPTGYTFETPDLRLPEPARTGYTFTGWKVTGAAAGSAGIAVDGVRSTVKQGTWGNLSCTATWRANQYAVALDAAFPAFAMGDVYEGYAPYGVSKDAGTASVTATFDAAMPAATMPHATGYAFEGYFDDAGTKYYDADGSSARTWDKPSGATLRARWTLERHELTLDVGNGEVPSAAGRGWKRDTGDSGLYRLSYSIEWVEESGGSLRIQLPAPATKPGYASFDGWTGPNLTKPSKSVQVQPWELADRDYVGAFSSPVGYSATLDLAGGSFADAPDGWSEAGGSWARGFTVESDAFGLPVPSRAGHDFSGWALVGADGSLGSPAASVTVPKGTVGDRSYRAVWNARSYSITWHYSGQSIDGQQSATSSQAYGAPIAFPSKPSVADPAREHYAFEGWFTEREGGERVEAGDYLLERDATFYARWRPVEYTVHLHLGDDDAYGEHEASIEKDGQALPLAPDGHFDVPYTVEGEVRLPMVTDDPSVPKPVREGMSFVGWVECAEDGSFDPDLVPSMEVVLPAGSHGERHYRAVWSVALRFEAPSAVSFRLDLADDAAFADAPHGPVAKVEGEGVELRSLSAGPLAVADVAVDVAGADPDSIVTDRSKVQLRVMDATLPDPWAGWVPLPTTPVPERVDPYDLASLGFGDGNALAPLASKPLRYEIEVQDPVTTLAGEVDLPLARIVLTVKGLW